MKAYLQSLMASLTGGDKHERLKLILLVAAFFLVIGSYTLIRELKNSIFLAIVGKAYIPQARLLTLIMLVPGILFYSVLVDRLRRYQLIYFYAFLYAIVGFISVYLLGHPTIGLLNSTPSPWRLFGWFFYFLIEGFSPFVVSVFWAFANSVFNPSEARRSYALLVSGSKIGGMITAAIAWHLLSAKVSEPIKLLTHVRVHQCIMLLFSVMVLLIPFIIYLLIKKVPGRYLHGYEAVYRFEKNAKEHAEEKTGVLSGLFMFIKWPYLFGIFGMLFFYEVISTILSVQRLAVAASMSDDIAGVSCFLFKTAFIQHFTGMLISFLGTKTLLDRFGERICLLMIPAITGFMLIYFLVSFTPTATIIVMVLLQAVNYAFAQPVRESLYIPTVKEIKFKSKSWIDAFGSRFSKSAGSAFVLIAEHLVNLFGQTLFIPIYSAFFGILTIGWTINAYLLGKRFAKAVKNQEIIGQEGQETQA